MGIGAWWHWLIVLVVVVLIFGTKKLRNLGGDVGGAVKSFKDAMTEEKNATEDGASAAMGGKAEEVVVIEQKAVRAPRAKAPAKKPAAKTTTASKSAVVKPKAPAKKTSAAKPKAEA